MSPRAPHYCQNIRELLYIVNMRSTFILELVLCKLTADRVKMGEMERVLTIFCLAQMEYGASAHARNRRISPSRAGRPGPIRRPLRQRMPAATLRRVPHRTDGGRAQD